MEKTKEVKEAIAQENKEIVNIWEELSNFMFVSKYSRYNEHKKRRETWDEAVDRSLKMHLNQFFYLEEPDKEKIKWAFDMVRQKRVVPSMRSLQFGGRAIEKTSCKIYNCSVRHVDSIRSFAEIMYLLLNGCGVGIGLSKYFLSRLPNLVDASDKTGTVVTYVIDDTIEGWADSIEAILLCYFKNTAYTGRKLCFDYSRIRKKGAPLKTSGGKAPGYKGLKAAHIKIKDLLDRVIEDLSQKRMKSINAYDIIMHCSDAVLSGGVRRSACAVMFDLDDMDMMNAKIYFPVDKTSRFVHDKEIDRWCGKVTIKHKSYDVELEKFDWEFLQKEKKISWFYIEPQRARSNNSVLLLRDKITLEDMKKIVKRTREFGEPGFVFANHEHQLFNPCFEANFIPVTSGGVCGVQMCNLTSINGAKIKSLKDLKECAEAATIIGTLQACYTNFPYLSNASKELTEEEALLGVSITGLMDSTEVLLKPENQQEAAKHVVVVNKEWAKKLGINQATRVTLIKPEGSASLFLGSASGIHPHHSHQYFRRIQCNKIDNVYKYFKKHNPHLCEESVWSANKTDDCVTFPLTPDTNCMVKGDLSAIKHLEIIKSTQQNWVIPGTTEVNKKPITHNISCTVVVKENEWEEVTKYLFENRAFFSAVSLLAFSSDKSFVQAPNEDVSTEEDKKKFKEYIEKFKHVDYTKLLEEEDDTKLQQELSCFAGYCEIIK